MFIDATSYLKAGGLTAEQLASRMIRDVFQTTGITATAGIGPNLYLCKVAMDIEAKHSSPDADGVRIASLDEESYRRRLWNHRPLTDFWRVGAGYARRLEERGLFTMGDIARCSLGKAEDYYNEDLLYRMFGVNAELLIDHAWGWEPCTMADIKAYRPESSSVGSGQVLHCPYPWEKARLVVKEMADLLALELVDKGLVTDQLVLTVGYDRENLTDSESGGSYRGEIRLDRYGRKEPVHAHGTLNLDRPTSSSRKLTESAVQLFEQITDPQLLVRRINIVANRAVSFREQMEQPVFEQLDLFTDYEKQRRDEAQAKEDMEREKKMQEAMLSIKKKFGGNAILKGMNLEEGATGAERNRQIGGHRA